jgi:hypothetical protein
MQSDRATVEQLPAPLRGQEPLRKEEVHDAKGYQGVFLYGTRLVFVRISGDIAAGAETQRITQYLRDTIAQLPGKVTVFMDLESFRRYHSDVRTRYTDALVSNSAKVEHLWVYADSKLVRMGATVAALALRQLHLVERATFDKELLRAIR